MCMIIRGESHLPQQALSCHGLLSPTFSCSCIYFDSPIVPSYEVCQSGKINTPCNIFSDFSDYLITIHLHNMTPEEHSCLKIFVKNQVTQSIISFSVEVIIVEQSHWKGGVTPKVVSMSIAEQNPSSMMKTLMSENINPIGLPWDIIPASTTITLHHSALNQNTIHHLISISTCCR